SLSLLSSSHPRHQHVFTAIEQFLQFRDGRRNRRSKMNKSVLSMCAGPLLLALAAKANDDYNSPA
ncbi:unnamed protein product, partial [Ectocarpus sp. 4 AP-2014]